MEPGAQAPGSISDAAGGAPHRRFSLAVGPSGPNPRCARRTRAPQQPPRRLVVRASGLHVSAPNRTPCYPDRGPPRHRVLRLSHAKPEGSPGTTCHPDRDRPTVEWRDPHWESREPTGGGSLDSAPRRRLTRDDRFNEGASLEMTAWLAPAGIAEKKTTDLADERGFELTTETRRARRKHRKTTLCPALCSL